MNVRIGEEYLAGNLREFARNIISNSVCTLACKFLPPWSLNLKFGTRRSGKKKKLYRLQNDCDFAVRFQPIKKNLRRKLTYRFFSCITGIETNMLLIVLLGLIARLTFASKDCNFGPPYLHDFDYSRVGICVLTCLLIQAAFKICALFHISFVIPITNTK